MLDYVLERERIEQGIRARATKISVSGNVDVLATLENGGVVELTLSEAW